MIDERHEHMTTRFVEAVDYLNRQVHAWGLDEWDGLEMTLPQIKTLVLLERMGPLRMGNIASLLGRALSATTTVVDRLVEKGLVDRAWDPSDRRVVVCTLTDRAYETLARFWRIRRENILLVAEQMGEEQLETAVRGLEVICAAHREAEGSPLVSQHAD